MNQNYKEQVRIVNRQIKELVGIYRDAVKRLDVSESEFWVWYTLVTSEEDLTQQDICLMWSLPKQTVNTIITQMREKNYAYLEAVSGRRSHKIIRLTNEGREYGENLILPITQSEEKAIKKIPDEEISLVNGIFSKYIDIIRSVFNEAEE